MWKRVDGPKCLEDVASTFSTDQSLCSIIDTANQVVRVPGLGDLQLMCAQALLHSGGGDSLPPGQAP